ncbi:hypothetical protein HMSSN036_13660 [Paenibacillus macerans]|nr:hypothetical protein HMSSN036_13660 [Paenibacillus macerans]
MKRARRFAGRMLAAALTVAVVLAACSNSGGTSEESRGGGQDGGKEQVTLKFSFWGDTIEKKTVTEALERFEQATGINVEPMHVRPII